MSVFVSRIGLVLLGGLVSGSLGGCASLPTLGEQDRILAESEPAEKPSEFFVEMHPILAKPKIYRGEITEPITIQKALDDAKARKIVKSAEVDLYRRLPNGGALKLPVEFNKKKRVKYEQDYALHPNDRIIVRSKSNSPIDKLVDQVFGKR